MITEKQQSDNSGTKLIMTDFVHRSKKGKAKMKKRRLTSAVLAAILALSAFSFTLASAEETAGAKLTLDLVDYEDGIVNGADSATLEVTEKDGKKALKITPNPKTTATSITVDGYNYLNAGIDLEVYRYAAIEYFYESSKPVKSTMGMSILKSGDVLTTNNVAGVTRDNLVTGTWAMAVFDFRALEPVINRNNPSLMANQIHIQPFAKTKPQQLTENDVMYISRIIFFENKPDFVEHVSYMNGYTDGTFLPGGTMTRAEACTVIARLLEKEENIAGHSAFADVPADQWFAKYVAFCESKGLLGSYSGNFLPNQPITRAEFSELVYLTGLAQDKGLSASFTDVAASHPRYASIMAAAKAGLIKGYAEADGTFTFKPDNTITRAEVVTVINRARGISKTAAQLTEDTVILFTDVDRTHWAFADIAEATVAHVESEGNWAYTIEDPAAKLAEKVGKDAVYGLDKGNAKVAELDTLEANRVAEIRNTPNIDTATISGTKIYVSSSTGDDKNSGTTPDAPVKTAVQANKLVSAGGAVFFKRGDLWRAERFTAKSGVTYTAYGEGAKPVFYGSPENGAVAENWSLVHEDASTGALIWMYKNQDMKDVGTIVFNEGEGFAMKETPSVINEKYITKGTKDTPFDYKKELDKNLEFVHILTIPAESKNSTGAIYLRCDNGNPGKVFDSIEFNTLGSIISVGGTSDVSISNLCLKYASFGIDGGDHANLNIKDTEIGWIGGNISGYRSGTPIRYGNGIECYGSCDGFVVDNCYIYECYDAGVTHQSSGDGDKNVLQDNIKYINNVITDCVYNIEYFLGFDENNPFALKEGQSILFEGNLLRRAGYGFGSIRPDVDNQRHIRCGNNTSDNMYKDFIIRNNIFDRAVHELVATTITSAAAENGITPPKYVGNVYIQGIGNGLFSHGVGLGARTNLIAKDSIAEKLGDTTAQVYFVDSIPKYSYSYVPAKTVPVESADRRVFTVAKAELKPSEGESTAVSEPLHIEVQKSQKIYREVRKATTLAAMLDEVTGITYNEVTVLDEYAFIMLDCYNIKPVVPVDSGYVYVKILMRTNQQVKPKVNAYGLKDANGESISGGAEVTAIAPTVGNGEWEEVIVKLNNFPSDAASTSHFQIIYGGNLRGSDTYKDGVSNAKFDIAGWAVFSNLASAKAFDLKTAAK